MRKNGKTYKNVYNIPLPKPKRPNLKQVLAQAEKKTNAQELTVETERAK